MSLKLVHISPISSFHIGDRGIGVEEASPYIRSDTLYGALIATISEIYGNDVVENIINGFKRGEPPFLLSSIFFYLDGITLLPLPLSILKHKSLLSKSIQKRVVIRSVLRKIRIVDERFFKDYCNGINSIEFEIEEEKLKRIILGNNVYIPMTLPMGELVLLRENLERAVREKRGNLYVIGRRPRNILDRVVHSSDIYYVGYVTYTTDLCFMIEILSEEMKDLITSAIKLLGDLGLGGERSVGFGKFRLIDIKDFKFPVEQGKYVISLSLYLPSPEELKKLKAIINISNYSIVLRPGSFSGSGTLRTDIRVFEEGSVFPAEILRRKAVGRVISGKDYVRIYSPLLLPMREE